MCAEINSIESDGSKKSCTLIVYTPKCNYVARVSDMDGTPSTRMSGTTARARVVWVLIDGVGDVGVPALDRQTPLQVRLHLRSAFATRVVRPRSGACGAR